MCFAGAESHIPMLKRLGANAVLCSAYYLKKNFEMLKDFEFVLIDSGGATFGGKMNEVEEMQKRKEDTTKLEKQIWEEADEWEDEYLDILTNFFDWKKREAPNLNICPAEFDFGGLERNQVRMKRYMEVLKGVDENAQLIPVWHYMEGPKVLEFLCERYPYVGFGGLAFRKGRTYKNAVHMFQVPMTIARKYKTKIHGFGITIKSVLERYPFYSVDSTSWLAGAQYGVTYHFDGRRLNTIAKHKKDYIRKRLKTKIQRLGLDLEAIIADKGNAVNELNASQWLEFSQYKAEKQKNAYWLKRKDAMGEESNGAETSLIPIEDEVTAIVPAQKRDIEDKVDLIQVRDTPLTCDTCYIGDRCPKFKEGFECAYGFDTTVHSAEDMFKIMQKLLEVEGERVFRAATFEKLDGGYIDKTVSDEIRGFFDLVERIKDIADTRDSIVIKAKGSGIISQIFGDKK